MTEEESRRNAAAYVTRPPADSDRSDGVPDTVAFAQRFVVVRQDVDDVQGVRFTSGRVIVDEVDGGFVAATCWVHLAERYGAGARMRLVWEGGQEPDSCCPLGEHPPA